MSLLILSFVAGMLTVLAPCILPLLPVVLGGAAADTQNKRRPFIIVASLGLSVFAFTFLLKASTVFIMVPAGFWSGFSAAIIALFGLALLFPTTWAKIADKIPGMHSGANKLLAKGYEHKTAWWGDVAIGIALGPIFTTCSPTYFLVLATVLPESTLKGTIYIAAYVLGLAVVLLGIAKLGQSLIAKLNWAANPNGWLKRVLGVLFLLVALAIGTGTDKKIETAILDSGYFDITKVEQAVQRALESPEPSMSNTPSTSEASGTPAIEIEQPAGFVNSEPFALKDLIGKKVILLDFVTYSCINCQRTFPYLNAWYDQYKDEGLEIVGIHTPEFAFEHNIQNVRDAAAEFGLEFPLVLDNDYGTWNAYKNRYWPRKYLIDIHGNIVYDHIGEGAYEETEAKIVSLLKERAEVLGEDPMGEMPLAATSVEAPTPSSGISPETYFGAARNEYFGNGVRLFTGERTYTFPANLRPNSFYLSGKWHTEEEFAETREENTALQYPFRAKSVYLVAESDTPTEIEIRIDGVATHTITVQGSKLYDLFMSDTVGVHTLELRFPNEGTRIYAFTFG
ncbi:MAG: hypothetical protein RL141_976 [Candidatus Parcubacteria bacterium]|jgi:cytochrome c biogenesis protein CcdA/thiol-disulfide isomerase/thioredoxin